MMKKSILVLSLVALFFSLETSARELNAGPWKFIMRTGIADIPFIIDFRYDKHDVLTGILHNGKERIILRDIVQDEKKVIIPIANYETSLEMTRVDENSLSGSLVRHNKNPVVKTPVFAVHGISERFKVDKAKPSINLTGKWSLVLEDEDDVKTPGIGTFKQSGNKFTGSILTPTGDFRYMEGFVNKNNFEAASFDGGYNYLFRGSLKDGKMTAALLSNMQTKVTGQLDPKAELPDAYKQTTINQLSFIFPDLKGQNVSLNHKKFKNKPVIVQIYGSWCPNCLDEMNFLIPWYKQNNKRGIEVIALAFERSLGPEEAKTQLLKVQKKMNVPYTILIAGSTAEDKPAEKISGLTNFISFPTTIFLDRKHRVVKVHAGFSGPSTGEYYDKWRAEFNQTVNQLLKK